MYIQVVLVDGVTALGAHPEAPQNHTRFCESGPCESVLYELPVGLKSFTGGGMRTSVDQQIKYLQAWCCTTL
jgi:hypothetical protein